jgi:hypothetical protein
LTILTPLCTNLPDDIIQATPTKIDEGIEFHAWWLRTSFEMPHLVDGLIPVLAEKENPLAALVIVGPLRQAFIFFFYVSGYTAGFGQNWMSALRLEPVFFK